MAALKLKVGDRVRAKVRTAFGWKGTGTVIDVIGDDVTVHKDGEVEDENGTALFCPHELAPIKGERR